jgi:nucleotide-binding universal stress UspA family protein
LNLVVLGLLPRFLQTPSASHTVRPGDRYYEMDTLSAALHSLLVPIDLTAGSDRILGRLSLLPLAVDARVTLLHVVPPGLPPREQRRAERDAHSVLTAEVRHLRKQIHKRVEIAPVVMVGAAAKQIAACATDAELIVMGRGRGRALRDIFLGSTAERVIRHAQRPVLAVRTPAREAYRRPALALDLDQAAHDVVRLMLVVLPPPRPGVEVIHAFENPYRGMLYPSLSRDDAKAKEHEIRSGATHALAKLLASALAKANVQPDGLVWKTHVKHGSPRIVVEKAIKKANTDLLVLGTRGHSGAAYVFLGTVAGDLLRAARCDVLIVPPASVERETQNCPVPLR